VGPNSYLWKTQDSVERVLLLSHKERRSYASYWALCSLQYIVTDSRFVCWLDGPILSSSPGTKSMFSLICNALPSCPAKMLLVQSMYIAWTALHYRENYLSILPLVLLHLQLIASSGFHESFSSSVSVLGSIPRNCVNVCSNPTNRSSEY